MNNEGDEFLILNSMYASGSATSQSGFIENLVINKDFKTKRKKLVTILSRLVHNFQNTFIINRRRSQQRLRRRQALLRSYYIQQMLTMSTRVIEILPILNDTLKLQTSKDANSNIYEEMSNYSHEQWVDTFRMSKTTFQNLCNQLEDVFFPGSKKPYCYKIPIEKRIAICLYGFASGEEYRKIAQLFQVSRVTVCKFMRMFPEALLKKFGDCLIKLPKDEHEYVDISEGLSKSSNMLALCVGILGHYELAVESSIDNTQSTDWIVLQALIDDRLLFRQVELRLNKLTCMYDEPKQLAKLPTHIINQHAVSCFLVTDNSDSMPLRPWLMHGYKNPNRPSEYGFNKSLKNLIEIKDAAFRRLLARWQILQHKTDLEINTMKRVALACCALHNLLEECEESYRASWELTAKTKIPKNQFKCDNELEQVSYEASVIRDLLAKTVTLKT